MSVGESGVITVDEARNIAIRFIEGGRYDCENPDPHGPQLSDHHHEYYLDGKAMAYEFPLTKNGNEQGYLLLSGYRGRQPILEYTSTGGSLRTTLNDCLRGLLNRLNILSVDIQWIYYGPLDIVAEVKMQNGKFLYARLPNIKYLESKEKIPFQAAPLSDEEWVAGRWRFYEGHDRSTAFRPCSKMFGYSAPLYNQTCYGSLLEIDILHTNNYCTPQCIVGCVATAWAMLAGTFESGVVTGKIYADSPDWQGSWQSSYGSPPPPGSIGVNRHMWNVNSYMGTTCAGNTSDSNTIAGSRLFRDFGVDWYWGSKTNADYSFAALINKNGYPFLLTAQSTWVPGEIDGHGVVVHGYNDNDAHLYITRGWGRAFPDVWIAFSSLSQVSVFFRAKPPASPAESDPTTALPFVL
ncbi:hypothetical protein PQR71_06895 [Paraburkholderia fungorum]|uniref:hypothetical protein n=1 Tax=Paraburkholderia fungorum TaxID=134537 RepID=UPI0038B6F9BD